MHAYKNDTQVYYCYSDPESKSVRKIETQRNKKLTLNREDDFCTVWSRAELVVRLAPVPRVVVLRRGQERVRVSGLAPGGCVRTVNLVNKTKNVQNKNCHK